MAIGSLAVRVTSNTGPFNKGMDGAGKRAKQFGRDVSGVTKTAAAMTAAITATAAGVAALTHNSIQSGKELANLSRMANASASEFQKMAFGAKTVGIENEKLADILKDVNDRVGDFITTGGGPMADFFERIGPKVGVTAENFRKLSGPQALQLYVDSLEKANVSQQEMTFFMEAMASDATRMLPLLRNGGEAMSEQAEQAERLGIAMSDIDVEQLRQAGIAIDQSKEILGSFVDQFVAQMAPVLTAFSEMLMQNAEDAGGVGKAAETSFNTVIDGISAVMNGYSKLERNLLRSQTTIDVFALNFRIALLEIAREIVEIPTAAVNEMISLINNIPGVDVDLLGMSDAGNAITSKISDAQKEILNLRGALATELNKPLPGDTFERIVAQHAKAGEESAKAMAEARAKMEAALGESGEGEGGVDGKTRDELAAKLQAIREANMTEVELLNEKFKMENEALNLALEQEMITKKEWAELAKEQKARQEGELTAIEEKASDARTKLAEQEAKAKRQALGDALSDLSTLMNSESRTMFEIGKAAALSGALVDAYAAVTGAYKVGASQGGPALGAAYATAAGLAAFQNVQAIRSASFGSGGGSAPSTGGGGSVTGGVNEQTEPVQRRSTSVDISLIGADSRDRAVAGSIIQQINEEIERGERIDRVGLS